MKKIFLITALLMTLSSALFSQTNYFNTSGGYTISGPQANWYEFYGLRFDFSEIGTSGKLDLVGARTHNLIIGGAGLMKSWYHLNGNNGFEQPIDFFTGSGNGSKLSDILFVKLRDGDYKKDVVLARNNTLQINQNVNNGISGTPHWFVDGGNGKYLTSGRYNYLSTREDVVAITEDNKIKIYKNLGNGILTEAESIFLNLTADKVILRQITDYGLLPFQEVEIDRDELIVKNGNNIKIYKNNNQNGFETITPFGQITTNDYLYDFEVADMNRDGYNDIIIVSGNSLSQTLKVYLNVSGSDINFDSPYMVKTLNTHNAKISIADIDKDGYKDIISVGYQGYTNVILGVSGSEIPDQMFYSLEPGAAHYKVMTVDNYNTGGISLFVSYANSYNNQYWCGIKAIPPTTTNPKPAPPEVKKAFQPDGPLFRPKLILNNGGERDFAYYQIWKKAPGQNDYSLYVNNFTGNIFVDYAEYIVDEGDGQGQGYFNCFYKVKSVDITSLASDFSTISGYKVGDHGCVECDDENSDNLGIKNNQNIKKQDYSILNFPNPFNPVTKIVYSMPKSGYVKLTVYNTLGQVVKELVNEYKQKGAHLVEFDGSNLSSGIYFYKIEANNFVQINKMVLVK